MARRNEQRTFLDQLDDPDFVNVIYMGEGLAIAELERLRESYRALAATCRDVRPAALWDGVEARAAEAAALRLVAGMDWLLDYFREREAAAEARLAVLTGC